MRRTAVATVDSTVAAIVRTVATVDWTVAAVVRTVATVATVESTVATVQSYRQSPNSNAEEKLNI